MTDMLETNYIPDYFSQKVRSNPQPVYAQIRETDPVYALYSEYWNSRQWILTRYEDCVTMLKHPQIGKEPRQHMPPELKSRFPEPVGPYAMFSRHLLDIDPPDHTRLRGLVHKAFTPHIVENMRPRIQEIADLLIADMKAKGEADLIADFGFPLPIIVIAELIGVPASERDRFRAWTKQFLFGNDGERVNTAMFEFAMYLGNMIDERQAKPQDDLLSALIAAKENGQAMDRQELLSMLFLLLIAGHETTVNLIGNGTFALLEHPDQMQKLQADPSLIRSAVEEMLRFNGPVETTTLRFAFEDVQIGGKTIKQGEGVLAALLSANRDPAVFENPDVFDITREPNKHIAFGNGIHYCVGAPLARMEGAIAINTLLHHFPNLHLQPGADATLEWSESILIHGLKALPVAF